MLTDAVVLVNHNSPNYTEFQKTIQPYLDHFGVPYRLLDTSHRYFDPSEQEGVIQDLMVDVPVFSGLTEVIKPPL